LRVNAEGVRRSFSVDCFRLAILLSFGRGMRVRDFFSRPDCYTAALAADIFMRGRWTDSECATMFDHVARQSASIYDDSRASLDWFRCRENEHACFTNTLESKSNSKSNNTNYTLYVHIKINFISKKIFKVNLQIKY